MRYALRSSRLRLETMDPGTGKSSVGGRERGVAWRTVDGRHRQRPWEGFKLDSNSLQFVGLKAEVFVVT
jgi:hypothetical protein